MPEYFRFLSECRQFLSNGARTKLWNLRTIVRKVRKPVRCAQNMLWCARNSLKNVRRPVQVALTLSRNRVVISYLLAEHKARPSTQCIKKLARENPRASRVLDSFSLPQIRRGNGNRNEYRALPDNRFPACKPNYDD